MGVLLGASLYLQQLALRVCFVQQRTSSPHLPPPRVISQRGDWAALPFTPPTQGWPVHSLLFSAWI